VAASGAISLLWTEKSFSCVFSLLLLLSACRIGGQSPFGRPGGWEDGRIRQRSLDFYVRLTGKALWGRAASYISL